MATAPHRAVAFFAQCRSTAGSLQCTSGRGLSSAFLDTSNADCRRGKSSLVFSPTEGGSRQPEGARRLGLVALAGQAAGLDADVGRHIAGAMADLADRGLVVGPRRFDQV